MKKNKNIIKKILIWLFLLFSINIFLGNLNITNANSRWDCYNDHSWWSPDSAKETRNLYNWKYTDWRRNSTWFWNTYDDCKNESNVDVGYYTFSNWDKIKIITIRNNYDEELTDIKNYSSFKAYSDATKAWYEKNRPNDIKTWEFVATDPTKVWAIVGCYNSLNVELLELWCTPNNTPPILSANKSEKKWKKDIWKITLTTDATDYSKYSWKSNSDCISNWTSFTNWTKIEVPWEWKNTLYLCAKSKAKNECSKPQTKTWKGYYWLDTITPPPPKKNSCNSNSKPDDPNLVFNNVYDDVINWEIDYKYKSDICWFECSEWTWNTSQKKCIIPPNPDKTCDETTKPTSSPQNAHIEYINQIFSDAENATKITYTQDWNPCWYKYVCDKWYSWDSSKTKCEKITPNPKPGCEKTWTCPNPDPRDPCIEWDIRPECINSVPSEIGFPFTNILAQNYNYQIQISTPIKASPIKYIKYQIEDEDTWNLWPVKYLRASDAWKFTWPMKKVDNFRKNGYREYTLRILEICDEAWNCDKTTQDIIHKVYANTTTIHSSINYVNTGIADWKLKEFKIWLKWKYWNQIVPASPINRTINFEFDTSNNLNLDQYENTWNAVFLVTPNNNSYTNKIWLGNLVTKFNNENSDNWEYSFDFKIYSPTNLIYDIDNHDFIINKLDLKINQADANPSIYNVERNLENNVDYNLEPLYTTTFSWEQKDNWFIEGATQSWWILNISKKAIKTTSNLKIKLEKAWDSALSFDWKWAYNTLNISYLDYGIRQFYPNPPANNIIPWNKNFTSFFSLKPTASTIKDISKLRINSWINYINDFKNITYIWDYVWEKPNPANAWLRVIWNTNIDKRKQKDITENQDKQTVHNVDWKINKASLKAWIKRNVYSIIKNINSDSNWVSLLNWKVEFYDYRQESNKIKRLYWNLWDKTIVILGWNAYITRDLEVWWIIVLKDDNWNWWNLYIDPSISKIEAAIYADKSLLSYNDVYWEISPKNGWTYELLKNQLYIKWAVFSENTIWGSRKNPPVCPYYTKDNCDLDKAQKYDLNYLRRWIKNKAYTSLGDYPVIIKYNPLLQINPPALFNN